MTPDDIEALFRFKGGHSMARMAANPDIYVSSWRTSMHGYCGGTSRVDTEAGGIRFSDLQAGTSRLITWKSIRAHALEHTTDEVRDWILAFDWEWCRASTHTPGFPPARAAICKHWLDHLARIVWGPALVAPPEPEQLDMLALLEEMTS